MGRTAVLTYSGILFLLVSCGGLTYVPVKTPAEFEVERREAVVQQLREDFRKTGMKYAPITFGMPSVVKSPSHFTLDSLYAIKYELEKMNQVSARIEEQIKVQQLVVSSDTTPSYFLEKHVFSVEDSTNFEVFYADLYVNNSNKIESVEIRESAKVQRKDANMYSCYVLQESFLYPHSYPDAAEVEFYALYNSKLQGLSGKEKQDFLDFMLSVMRTASRYESLDKAFLIQEFTRQYVQGTARNMLDENFLKMEEFFNEEKELLYYYIDYECSMKDTDGDLVLKRFDVYLDPWLQLIEVKNKP
ncbi:MAG: hypothetical protein K0R65_2670 [Crocinitomicaceae bacterium]|jgi:hypothetical protein|nr:hypothetical protein [Crocinitomicaceae bacterium]